MAAGKWEKNNNKPAGRGRPPGRPRGKAKTLNRAISSNYTLDELQEKKKRSMNLRNQSGSPAPASPAKRRTTIATMVSTRSSASARSGLASSPSAIPVPISSSTRQTRMTENIPIPSDVPGVSPQSDSVAAEGGRGEGDTPTLLEDSHSLSAREVPCESVPSSVLNQLLDKFNTMENKLGKLDTMEKQLGKLDVIEAKATNIGAEVHNIQKSVESINKEIDTIKARVNENHATLKKDLEDFKSQQKVELAEAIATIRKEVTQESQRHFNAFTKHIENAFVREQTISRRGNLIFTGVQESIKSSDLNLILDICHSYLGISNLSIDVVYRLGAFREASNSPRPILVRFGRMADRTRVWKAKKLLQRAPGGKIWIQEDMPRCLREDLRILLRVARHAEALQKEEYKEIRVRDFQLLYQGRSYGVSELEFLPPELRPSSLCIRGTGEALTFFGRYTPLSNHHRSPFRINGILYNTVEQYLAVARASLAGKKDLKARALSQPDPADSKKILNTLKNDHIQEWEDQRATVLMEALRSKFLQNNYLAKYLKETSPLLLGEASRDPVWGTGLNLSDEDTTDHTKWKAQGNLLGHSLMEIRGELLKQDRISSLEGGGT